MSAAQLFPELRALVTTAGRPEKKKKNCYRTEKKRCFTRNTDANIYAKITFK